jgi:hypothetical protein
MTAIVDPRQDVGRRRDRPLLGSGLGLTPTRRPAATLQSAKIGSRWLLAVWRAPSWRWPIALATPYRVHVRHCKGQRMCAELLATAAATYRFNGPT